MGIFSAFYSNTLSSGSITGVTPSLYSSLSGSFPIDYNEGSDFVSGNTENFSGVTQVGWTGISESYAYLELEIDSVIQEQLSWTGDGVYDFSTINVTTSNDVSITAKTIPPTPTPTETSTPTLTPTETSTPTLTPSESPTPSVTPTTWGGCITWTDNFYDTVTSPCGSNTDTRNVIGVQLLDQPGGSAINAPVNIVIVFSGNSSSSCPDFNGVVYYNVQINAGNDTAQYVYVQNGYDTCPTDSTCDNFSIGTLGISGITPSVFQICADITPTPTASETPTPTPSLSESQTPSQTPTYTPTPSTTPYANISLINNNTGGSDIASFSADFSAQFNGYFPVVYPQTLNGQTTGMTTSNIISIYITGGTSYQLDVYEKGVFTSGYTNNTPYTEIYNPTQTLGQSDNITFILSDSSVSQTPTQTPTQTPSQTPTNTETPTTTPTIGSSPTATETPTETPTQTPSQTPSNTPSQTPSNTPTETPTETPTQTASQTPSQTSSETPTQTPTNTETPTQTPTNTETPTTTPTIGSSPTATETPTETPTQTPSETPSQTPSQTPTETPSQTPSQTATQTPSQTPTNTETPTTTPTIGSSPTATETPTETPTQTPTNTETPTQTSTETPTQTPTNTETPTQTPTNTETPTQTPSNLPPTIAQFRDCSDGSNIFRFGGVGVPTIVGNVYYITGSTEFEGCATVVTYTGAGPLFNSTSVTFTNITDCTDTLCPRTSVKAAELSRCSDELIGYFFVDSDTAYEGAVYLYNGECWEFEEFSGPGGPYVGSPVYDTCLAAGCIPTPTPTVTTSTTPTNTPTVSVTPSSCSLSDFCFYTGLPSLSGLSGNYTFTGVYNSHNYWVGDGTTTGYIYYTGSYWCLSTSLGGTCLLRGAEPCYSPCPDISENDFGSGICPTPTPTPSACTIDFSAYFDCDYVPPITPSPTIDCDDVDMDFNYLAVTPTPTSTGLNCIGKAVNFTLSAYTSDLMATPTPTASPMVPDLDIMGNVTFRLLEKNFECPTTKIINQCGTDNLFYVSEIYYSGGTIIPNVPFYGIINGEYKCLKYVGDSQNISPNSIISFVQSIFSTCDDCLPNPTETTTPTPTATPTGTPVETVSSTPTQTATQTTTPTTSPTPNGSATPTTTSTPTQTPTNSATMTPTPSITSSQTPTITPSPSYFYVYRTCEPNTPSGNFTEVIQNVPIGLTIQVNESFKDDDGTCWFFKGVFSTNYIPPTGVIPIYFNGNYFAPIIPTTVYNSCTACLESCTGITINLEFVMNSNGLGPIPIFMPPVVSSSIPNYNWAIEIYDGSFPSYSYLPQSLVTSNGVVVSQQFVLPNCQSTTIENINIGYVEEPNTGFIKNIEFNVIIDGILQSQTKNETIYNPSSQPFANGVTGFFFYPSLCVNLPCNGQLLNNSTLRIEINRYQ